MDDIRRLMQRDFELINHNIYLSFPLCHHRIPRRFAFPCVCIYGVSCSPVNLEEDLSCHTIIFFVLILSCIYKCTSYSLGNAKARSGE
jgi:hypothetical protein